MKFHLKTCVNRIYYSVSNISIHIGLQLLKHRSGNGRNADILDRLSYAMILHYLTLQALRVCKVTYS